MPGLLRLSFTCIVFLAFNALLSGCKSNFEEGNTWTMYKADPAASSYSPLAQINVESIKNLKVAWIFDPNDGTGLKTWYGSQSNPIVIDSFMYVSSKRNKVYGLNATTGKKIWEFDPFKGSARTDIGGQSRGVVYWSDGKQKRILFTAGHFLYAIDALTGKPIKDFGKDGMVNLNVGMKEDPDEIEVVATSPGIIYKDLIILGSRLAAGKQNVPGYNRAYNVKTGKLVWTFHTIPLPGEPGYETWPDGAWEYVGGANDWGGMSLDVKRGIVFSSTASPTYDYYGGDRKGENLYGNCVLALDANTGKLLWYYQTVHHDLWGYDLTTAPNLVTIRKDGKEIDVVVQVTKHGFVFVLDRETGKPVFPVVEKKVPVSDVPGEEAWPTQPFPVKPAPVSKNDFGINDLSDFSSEGRDSLVGIFNSLRYEGIFTPPSLKGTFTAPGSFGGVQWGGGAYDPETGVLYIKSNNSAEIALLEKVDSVKGNDANDSTEYTAAEEKERIANGLKTRYRNVMASVPFLDIDGNPGIKPPWGVMSAINLNTGDYLWQVPVGNEPKLQQEDQPETGLVTTSGAMVTKGGLVFIAGTRDKEFRAFDKSDGELVWKYTLPGVGGSIPSSYYLKGKQYIAISVSPGGAYPSGCVVVFSL